MTLSDDEERRCQKCHSPTNGEEAYVNGQIWCHSCADNVGIGEFCCSRCGLKHTWNFAYSMCCNARIEKIP